VQLDGVEPLVVREGQTAQELEEYIGYRWWSASQILSAQGTRFFPSRLPEELEGFLRGDVIEEPFDHWN
jgi:hypothetical protein